MAALQVAVLMGGFSSERPVSLASGTACANALENAGYRVKRVDVNRDLAATLAEIKPDVCFNALHGPFGEDGTVQGILEYLAIPYTHSGVLASALAMNKDKAKQVAGLAGIPVAESRIVLRGEIGHEHPMDPPYVMKPVSEGSSFGVIIVREGTSTPPQSVTSDDWTFGEEILVERYVHGRELTCAVMGDRVLGVTEIVPVGQAFYDYDAKYKAGGSRHVCPAELSPSVYQNIEELSLRAHRALGCRGVTRSDFRFDDRDGGTGELVWLEINTQPGMTPTSLVPELAAHQNLSFEDLVDWMVKDASCRR